MSTSALSEVVAGLNLSVAITLLCAAVAEMHDIQVVERLLVETLPPGLWALRAVDSRGLALLAIVIKVACGLALLVSPLGAYPAVAAAVVGVLVVIVGVAARAAARKVPCGCFGGSRRAAGVAEVARALALMAVMTVVFAMTVTSTADPAGTGIDPTVSSATPWSVVLAAFMTGAALAPSILVRTRRHRPSPLPIPFLDAETRGEERVPAESEAGSSPETSKPMVGGADYPPRCQAAYDRCIGDNPAQKQCCIDCYVSCQNYEHKCEPGVSCGESWHDPFGLEFQTRRTIRPPWVRDRMRRSRQNAERRCIVGVAHLGPDEMAYFADHARRDPRAVRAEQRIRDYAERTGWLTLQYWQLALGHLWGQPHMMTMDEAGKRLRQPLSELQQIDHQTNQALGWTQPDPPPGPAGGERGPTSAPDHDA